MKYKKPKGLADLKKAVKQYKNSVIVYDKWWEQITEIHAGKDWDWSNLSLDRYVIYVVQ